LRRILFNKELAAELKGRFDGAPPDFIYERASLYGTAGVALAKEFNVPLLLELNAPLAVEQNAYRATGLGELAASAEQWVLTQAQAVLAVSAPLREHAISLGAKPERVHVVPNGVDPARFQPGTREPAVRARWRLGEGPLLGFVGGLRPWHGVEILPALLERLARRHKKLRLVIVGEGQLRPELEQSVQERGLASRVLFTGGLSHEEVPSVIRHFDIALAPYPKLEHAFYFSPLKLFEYMACGLAVVAADVGQVSEVLRSGKTGLLYPPGDLDALTGVCDRLLNNPRLRMRLGRAASKMVHTHFTWDHNANRVEQLARDLIAARRLATPSR